MVSFWRGADPLSLEQRGFMKRDMTIITKIIAKIQANQYTVWD